jgi:photosystem II stability/assembly factor-like uncharacterized protein
MKILAVLAMAAGCAGAFGQFDLEESHSTASLRGVDSVGAGTVWASGSGGTVLRSEDGGFLWQTCAMPKGAEKLDFRGVRALDAKTAYVMSSGKGPLSKVFKTTDGCATWTLVLDDPDADGFFDALRLEDGNAVTVLGDPVGGKFVLLGTADGGRHWTRVVSPGLAVAAKGIGAFAASNSSLSESYSFGTGGPGGPFFYQSDITCTMNLGFSACLGGGGIRFQAVKVPMAGATESAGIFSLGQCGSHLVAVGGEYTKPQVAAGTAAYLDDGAGWIAAKILPSGYRSAVGFDAHSHVCLAVGPSGADVSHDDGATWHALRGDAVTGWNAISLPFVVGEKGKIGKLRAGALQ